LSALCNRVLAADKRVLFAMIVDERGKIHCEKAKAGEKYTMPREMILQIGGVWASVVGGIFKQLSEFHGHLEYVIIKNEKLTTIGMGSKQGYVIFTTREKDVQQIIEKVKDKIV
jgi:hypothetical protein